MNAQVKTMTALVRRELWEHRAFWLAPAVMAGLFTLLMLRIGFKLLTDVPADKIAQVNAKLAASPAFADFAGQTHAATMVYSGIGIAIGTIMCFIALFYLLDSLYGDRRDRSILFWRSMPITDGQTVLSKVLTVTVAAPLCVLGVLLAGYATWGALSAVFGLAAGLDYWWVGLNPIAWLWAAGQLLVVTIGATLIMLPFIGYLLVASAWAPRAPFLWAALPVVGISILEEMVFDTSVFIETLANHPKALFPKMFAEGFEGFGIRGDVHDTIRISGGFDFSGAVLLEPRLWVGVALGAGLVMLAVHARRLRDDAST